MVPKRKKKVKKKVAQNTLGERERKGFFKRGHGID